jgi:hypothetical protein
MHRHVPGSRWVALLLCALAGAPQVACMGPRVLGGIPPSSFQFTPVVPHAGSPREGGGWKVAQVRVLLGRLSPMFPEAASCDVEVGVPEVTRSRVISDEYAQLQCSLASDTAAQRVLRQRQPTALMCQRFRIEMQSLLNGPQSNGPIPGARVTSFRSEVPHTTFP